ncbi:MAG: sulfotransferase family protein [Actinomycetota bacterium]
MGLRVVGAGLPRTGTTSLKRMLEQLLAAPCYHMIDLHQRVEEDGPRWARALNGETETLDEILAGFAAAVDWPASVFWRELTDRHPDALVILSHRSSSEEWWASADATVWSVQRQIMAGDAPELFDGFHQRMRELAGFSHDLAEEAARRRYDTHFADVVAHVPDERLLIWHPADGWEPLCERLDVPVPDAKPAHANTTDDFKNRQIDS